jgi:chemotaxis signal transduction protein
MVPIDHAFAAMDEANFEISQELLLSILQHSEQFPQKLKQIPIQATDIQYNLNRAIWNGNVKQSNSANNNKQFSRALLQEIRNTGERTKGTIGTSMANLTKIMVLGDSQFLADLILDIMDRNLYERANDCRWWALTPDFRKILENEQISREEREKVSSILAYINDLYTVYTNLFVYDKNGVIVAVSKLSQNHLIGQKLSQEWVEKTLNISDSSQYCVSDFETTSLYDAKHTYIYSAPIRSLDNESKVLGGIGVVFDSDVQFRAMIQESLPRGVNNEGLFAVLVTKEQYIIASNNVQYVAGDFFEIDKKFFELKKGESLSEIIERNGNFYALGVQCSKGYREYKSDKDDYVNDVYSFVFSYISDIEETKVEAASEYILEKNISIESNESSMDIASFYIGTHWLGFHAEDVIESIHIDELRSTIQLDKNHHYKGNVIYKDQVIYVVDIQNFINENVDDKAYEEIILIRFGSSDKLIGILVNSLGDIPEIHRDRIRPLDKYVVGDGTLVESMVFPIEGETSKKVLSILSVKKISDNLVKPEKTHMIPRKVAVG